MLISKDTSANTITGEYDTPQSPAPVVTQPTALPTAPNATNWRKQWTALWIAETRQAMAAKGARDVE